MGKDFRHRRGGEYIPHKSGKGSQRHRESKWTKFDEDNLRPVINLEDIEASQVTAGPSKYQRKKFDQD